VKSGIKPAEDEHISRRQLLELAGAKIASTALGIQAFGATRLQYDPKPLAKPNLVFIFADQWRAQATGYAGDSNARTPNLDRLASESVEFTNAVSCCPVCSPFRASLMTGQYPLTHGVFLNDVPLSDQVVSIAEAYSAAGYETAYIGKWHLNGYDRTAPTPRGRRQGFKFWKAFECTHDYNNSLYYTDDNTKVRWDGYDAIAQTKAAQDYIENRARNTPFLLILSWGPPHDPYGTAPAQYRKLFADKANIRFRSNVPQALRDKAAKDLSGYYAHIAALDDCLGNMLSTLQKEGLDANTILVFTSDHGDMLYSHGRCGKQQPWDECIRIPFLIRYPNLLGTEPRTVELAFNAPDIMPTLLGLSGLEIPDTVEGRDLSTAVLSDNPCSHDDAALLVFPWPFAPFSRDQGGREWRGVRTRRYTYVRDLKGPWLFYDNQADPHQLTNLCTTDSFSGIQKTLDEILMTKLRQTEDEFLPGEEYIRRWAYRVDKTGGYPLDKNGNPPWRSI
jgi:arylsulfatase A-like enzyme